VKSAEEIIAEQGEQDLPSEELEADIELE